MVQLLWFIGAGASAPFGIPTMQQMVMDFKVQLEEAGTAEERALFGESADFAKRYLGRPVDLEGVFTIVDSIANWSPEKMGIAALFHALRAINPRPTEDSSRIVYLTRPVENEVKVAQSLSRRFEEFIKTKCDVGSDKAAAIERVYGTLFDTIANFIGPAVGPPGYATRTKHVTSDWPIFTTNYDAILECYWMDIVKTSLNTGFEYNDVARSRISKPDMLRSIGGLKLLKLHGSVTWLTDPDWGLTEQSVVPRDMRKYTGSTFSGQVMVYPILEKELYSEPYMTMFNELYRELMRRDLWAIVGYSFGDRIIRDLFLRMSRSQVRLVLLHPHANQIVKDLERDGFRGRLVPLEEHFGLSDYAATTQQFKDALLK
jgi:hypothetical protein